MVKDPVCGRQLDFALHTEQTLSGGWTVYFCSPECKAEFLRDPGAYRIEHAESVLVGRHKFEI